MKKKFKVLFELYGKKMQTTVIAKDEHDARMQVLNKIVFHSVRFESFVNEEDDALDALKKIFNL